MGLTPHWKISISVENHLKGILRMTSEITPHCWTDLIILMDIHCLVKYNIDNIILWCPLVSLSNIKQSHEILIISWDLVRISFLDETWTWSFSCQIAHGCLNQYSCWCKYTFYLILLIFWHIYMIVMPMINEWFNLQGNYCDYS